jgi:hypothetical protein
MKKEEERLQAEIAELLKQQLQTDEAEDAALGSRRGDELPEELRFREERLAKILQAKARLEEQAKVAAATEKQRRAEAEAEWARAGKKRPGKEPRPVREVPEDRAQTNFTDPELKIMPQSNKSFEYSGNAQAVVDDACQIIVACNVVQEANDKQQAVPMAQQALANLAAAGIERPVDAQGQVQKIASLEDTGYFSAEAVSGLEALGFDPHMATERRKHHTPLGAVQPASSPGPATAKDKMQAKLRTACGRAVYGLRKGVVEPVFGQIKGVRGFRRFSMRGLEKIKAEWSLVCLTHNLLKIWRYHYVPSMN